MPWMLAAVNDVVMAITLMRCTDKVLSHKISLTKMRRDESYRKWQRAWSEESRRRVQRQVRYAAIARLRLVY
jgi:hypothetical protein